LRRALVDLYPDALPGTSAHDVAAPTLRVLTEKSRPGEGRVERSVNASVPRAPVRDADWRWRRGRSAASGRLICRRCSTASGVDVTWVSGSAATRLGQRLEGVGGVGTPYRIYGARFVDCRASARSHMAWPTIERFVIHA
jgi:hypothetical protein